LSVEGWKMMPQPNKEELKEFHTLSDLLQLKLGARSYILLYERINGEAGVVFHNTNKEEVVGLLRETADEISKATEDDFGTIRENEPQN
jgi:hypothetical protein